MSNKQRPHSDNGVTENPWQTLRAFTAARIALGRSGVSMPTQAMLQFQLAHAQARDAVHTGLNSADLFSDVQQLSREFPQLPQQDAYRLHSAADNRRVYLQRPDLGRQLNTESMQLLQKENHALQPEHDLALVIGDGLSARAIHENAVPFLRELLTLLAQQRPAAALSPVSIVQQARVAIGDDIGEQLNARAVLIMIGERPGLSSPDSMGLYLTWQPRRGLTDDKRNCISNVRKAGLCWHDAARKVLYLLSEAQRLQGSGVVLKDRSDEGVIDGRQTQKSFLTCGSSPQE